MSTAVLYFCNLLVGLSVMVNLMVRACLSAYTAVPVFDVPCKESGGLAAGVLIADAINKKSAWQSACRVHQTVLMHHTVQGCCWWFLAVLEGLENSWAAHASEAGSMTSCATVCSCPSGCRLGFPHMLYVVRSAAAAAPHTYPPSDSMYENPSIADLNHSLLDTSGAARWAASVYYGEVHCFCCVAGTCFEQAHTCACLLTHAAAAHCRSFASLVHSPQPNLVEFTVGCTSTCPCSHDYDFNVV